MNTDTTALPARPPIYLSIRTMVRTLYDFQKMRIQTGNRLCSNFRSRLGIEPGQADDDIEQEKKKILDLLHDEYQLFTNNVVSAMKDEQSEGKMPTKRKFDAMDGKKLITDFAELVTVDQYEQMWIQEKRQLRQLDSALTDVPIYTEYLEHVQGIGPTMAGVIISEIDITKATYPTSLHKFAGLDVIIYGKYTNDEGKEKFVSAEELDVFYAANGFDYEVDYLAEGKYPVKYIEEGRSKKRQSLVQRAYLDGEGEEKFRDSITYNPFLKTKLIGVLSVSFLRSGTATVDGKRMGGAARLKLAKADGYKPDTKDDAEIVIQVIDFLRAKGHDVIVEPNKYGKIYTDYKRRLQQMPSHKEKKPGHIHAMASRYMVKRFLNDLYNAWRPLENLVVAPSYEEEKLGIIHGVAGEAPRLPEKRRLMARQEAFQQAA